MSARPLCRLDDLPQEGVREFASGRQRLIAWRRGAEVRVFVNRCPHFRIPLNFEPGVFPLYGGLLMCVHHYSYFRFPGGECAGGPCEGEPLESVPSRIVDGEVRLD